MCGSRAHACSSSPFSRLFVQALVAGGVETVADLAGLDYQDLGKYDLPRDVRDKLGRVVSVMGMEGEEGGRNVFDGACVLHD